ncbi:MAG: A/G-specific adenine glycosylase [Deltaproteobacteria bacterium]|nr:A/G-specific adenine glycosylase [Deltaproteobacteria bacterium]
MAFNISKKLLEWFDRSQRVLPWRANKDPYRIWISEIMLQQTTVKTVLPYYERFLQKFPTLLVLAKSPLDKVLTAWSGLGYYSRARNLHKAAGILVKKYRGKFPKGTEGLQKLPGIGRYTAGAIASIAFDEKVPVLDGNLVRVLTRFFALRGDPRKTPLLEELWTRASSLLPQERCGDHNQSLMELGATVCLPKEPLCLFCPLQSFCEARRLGIEAELPEKKWKTVYVKRYRLVALIEKQGKFLLAQRPQKKRMGGLWEFPNFDLKNEEIPGSLSTITEKVLGIRIRNTVLMGKVSHAIMNERFVVPVVKGEVQGGTPQKNIYTDFRWIAPGQLANYPSSSINRKVLGLL